jgi:hypothetical protein
MRVYLFGVGLLALCLGCDGDAPPRQAPPGRVDVDVSKPGGICEVHNVPMQQAVVPIRYGLIRPTRAEVEARLKLFPHAASSYHAGCVVKEAKTARVSICPQCRMARTAWRLAWEKKMAPVRDHWERVSDLVRNNPKFKEVDAYIDEDNGPRVRLEGSVKSEQDLAELRRMVTATVPPQPVHWDVRVSP